MAVFSDRMVPEKVQAFWAALQAGEFITAAAARAGTYRVKGRRWIVAAGGVRPRRGRHLVGRYLSFGEREEIALGRARGESLRRIAARLGRSASTVSRELRRNGDGDGYRATSAHALAYQRAARPKPAKLATNAVLRGIVEGQLRKRYSPEQIAGRAVPGHWEGDLLIGAHNQTAIGTLVERATGYTMLLHLPSGYGPEQVRDALAGKIQTLPAVLRRSLTWDQGPEMGLWKQVAIAADIAIYFCDPHAPWQRGSNEK